MLGHRHEAREDRRLPTCLVRRGEGRVRVSSLRQSCDPHPALRADLPEGEGYFFENRFRFRTSSRFFFSILSASNGNRIPRRTRSFTACSNRAAYVSKFPYRSSIDRRGSALSMRCTLVFGNGIYWPAASQPSSVWGAARRAHPVLRGRASVTPV